MEQRGASASWVFREAEYQLSCIVRDDTLEVTVEETVTTNRWMGKFEAKHIEELTRKTGNFKQFPVFMAMLESAINKSSECVTLDLLTYSDLEALRDRRNGVTTASSGPGHLPSSAPSSSSSSSCPIHPHSQGKRYLILTYSVEFDRIHYPLALGFVGQADSAQLKETLLRLASELERYKKKDATGKRSAALTKLQKDYNALLREKEALEEVVVSLQAQLVSSEGQTSSTNSTRQLKMLQEVVRNMEEEVLQERNKHQKYVSKKTEEMRALTQELGELRSSERTLRSRVKNLTNELAVLKKGLRFSPSNHYIRPRHSPSTSVKKTPPSSSSLGGGSGWRGSQQRRSYSGSVEKRGRHGSHERRSAVGVGRSRTPSPRGGRMMRFDPSAYVESKRRQKKEIQDRFQRLHSPSYHGSGTHSRSGSLEKVHLRSGNGGSLVGRPPAQQRSSGSRRIWSSTPDDLRGTRTRSSSLGSLTGRSSSRGSSAASSRVSSRRPSFSDIEPSPPTSRRGSTGRQTTNKNQQRKRKAGKNSSTPISSSAHANKSSGSMLDHSAEMSEIDARLKALQQFMKRSLEASAKSHSNRR